MKIIITKSQLKLITEAVGVPEGIIQAGETLYEIVSNELKKINSKEEEYEFNIFENIIVSDITFTKINIKIMVEEIDEYDGKPLIASMGARNTFRFDEGVMLQFNHISRTINLQINFIVSKDWDETELYQTFIEDEIKTKSIMSHEVMHRFQKQKKRNELIGRTADYQAYSSGKLNFGIPVLDKFMRFSYFIQTAENVVRAPEIASRMIQKGVKKEDFLDFINNDEVFVELKEIRDFSYDYLIGKLYDEMKYVDRLLEHIDEDPTQMSDEEKIKSVLELVYVNLANLKSDIFDNYFYTASEKLRNLFGDNNKNLFGDNNKNLNKEKVRNNFNNHITKYRNREMDFFKDECERFNYVSTKLMKKISKIYSLIPDEKGQTNESILDWELHQKLMEKRYGKRPIQKSYNFKK
jgi:hypothetical protein